MVLGIDSHAGKGQLSKHGVKDTHQLVSEFVLELSLVQLIDPIHISSVNYLILVPLLAFVPPIDHPFAEDRAHGQQAYNSKIVC